MAPPDANQVSLDLLRTFVAFAEIGRVEETARHLKLTQAAVSLQLKKLETELKVPMFKIIGRKKVLTLEAQDLASGLMPLIKGVEKTLTDSLKKTQSAKSFSLRAGCRPELIKKVLPYIQHEGPIKFFSSHREESLKALQEDRLDLAILSDPPDSTHLIAKKLFQDDIKIVIHSDIIKSRRKGNILELADIFLREPFVGYKEDAPFLYEFSQYLGKSTQDFNKKYICEEWGAVSDMVVQFKAWALVPNLQIQERKDTVILEVPANVIKPTQFYGVYSAQLKGRGILKSAV